MRGPDAPGPAARPTLFGTPSDPSVPPLRMLPSAPPRTGGVARWRRASTGAALLAAAVAGGLGIRALTASPAAPAPLAVRAPIAAVAAPPASAPLPAARIESIPPAPWVVARPAPTPAPAPALARIAQTPAKPGAPTTRRQRDAPPRPPAPKAAPADADADVDLLAALVARLRADENAARPVTASPPRRRDGAADDTRSTAR